MDKIIRKITDGISIIDKTVNCEKEVKTDFELLKIKRNNLIKKFCLECKKEECLDGVCDDIKEYEKWVKLNITL